MTDLINAIPCLAFLSHHSQNYEIDVKLPDGVYSGPITQNLVIVSADPTLEKGVPGLLKVGVIDQAENRLLVDWYPWEPRGGPGGGGTKRKWIAASIVCLIPEESFRLNHLPLVDTTHNPV